MNNDELYYDFKKEKEKKNVKKKENNISYIYKFKIALYSFILFIILSNKNTYKILDIIIKIFRKTTNDIIDENGNPQILGTGLIALLFALLIFFIN